MSEDVKNPAGCNPMPDILERLQKNFPECEKLQEANDLSSGIIYFNSWAQELQKQKTESLDNSQKCPGDPRLQILFRIQDTFREIFPQIDLASGLRTGMAILNDSVRKAVGESEPFAKEFGIIPEQIAKKFHELYEEMAPDFGYKTREDSAVPWEEVPETNKNLMRAVCDRILTYLEETLEIRKPEHYKVTRIIEVDVEIESNGDRYLDFTDQDDNLIELTLPHELVEEFIKDMQVTTDYIDGRNQRAWEAVEKIRKLDEINLGIIAQCLKDVPFAQKTKEESKEDPEEVPIHNDLIRSWDDRMLKEAERIRKVRLKRDLNLPEEFGMKIGAIFETNTASKEVVCIKAKNGKFVTLKEGDFEEVGS